MTIFPLTSKHIDEILRYGFSNAKLFLVPVIVDEQSKNKILGNHYEVSAEINGRKITAIGYVFEQQGYHSSFFISPTGWVILQDLGKI